MDPSVESDGFELADGTIIAQVGHLVVLESDVTSFRYRGFGQVTVG